MPVDNLKIIYKDPRKLVDYEANTRTHSDEQISLLRGAIRRFGFTNPVLLKDDGKTIGAGHARRKAAVLEGLAKVPTITLVGLTDDEWRAYVIADNRLAEKGAGWDAEALEAELDALRGAGFDAADLGFDDADLEAILGEADDGGGGEDDADETPRASLQDRFGAVPFSVLNARDGWWQDRKRAWLALGIQSEVGRGENLIQRSLQERVSFYVGSNYQATVDFINAGRAEGLDDDAILARATANPSAVAKGKKGNGRGKARTFGQDLMKGEHVVGQTASLKGGLTHGTTVHPYDGQDGGVASGAGTSIFDPVLCELAYRWFCPADGIVLDPFAGGSVRGIVAGKLGRRYIGHELRPEQVDANRQQGAQIIPGSVYTPTWVEGDSLIHIPKIEYEGADFIFSCPPYADLEVYSDMAEDLSTMEYSEFLVAYRQIVRLACDRLKEDRFACFVVGDIRDKRGAYRNFVSDTIGAFLDAGLCLYNEAILVTAAGSLPIRAGKQFTATRKLGKTHQNVLVFVKGDARRATEACGEVEFGDIEGDGEAAQAPAGDEDDSAFGETL